MAKNKTDKEVNLLRRALKVAAIEAYQHEVVDTEMDSLIIGNDKEFSSINDWIKDKVDSWLQEAELLT